MGLCASVDDRNSGGIDTAIRKDRNNDRTILKLLLLGAGGSGKSTLFKQMTTIYGKGFSDPERKSYKPIIFNNMVMSMKTLCLQSVTHGTVSCAESKTVVEEAKEEDPVSDALAAAMKELWLDEGIKATYAKRSAFQLNDSTAYFMDQLDEVAKPEYIPSAQDVLRSRVPTTGVVENAFEIDGNMFKMYDMGGQRSERKKWIHCFENVTAVLFVCAISAYDQMLYEDQHTNRMVESLELFEDIVNSKWFEKTSVILFLNKKDLFEEKILQTPLEKFWPKFQGGGYEESCEFVKGMFNERFKSQADFYIHLTCATDTNNVNVVFNVVTEIIIQKSLVQAGLIM